MSKSAEAKRLIEPTEVTIFTTPSTRVRADLPPTPTPFKQVVGIWAANTLLSLPAGTMPDRASVSEYTYTVPWQFAFRLGRYFDNQFTGNRTIKDPDLARNCFHFGLWMARGTAYQTREQASELVHREARYTPPLKSDRVGEFSVIRSLVDFPDEPVLHGLVKLDDKTGEYIHVTTRGGDLAICTAAEALDNQESDACKETVVGPLFGIDPATWAVGHFSVSDCIQRDYKLPEAA